MCLSIMEKSPGETEAEHSITAPLFDFVFERSK